LARAAAFNGSVMGDLQDRREFCSANTARIVDCIYARSNDMNDLIGQFQKLLRGMCVVMLENSGGLSSAVCHLPDSQIHSTPLSSRVKKSPMTEPSFQNGLPPLANTIDTRLRSSPTPRRATSSSFAASAMEHHCLERRA